MEGLPAGLSIIDWHSQASILLATGELTVTFGISNSYAQTLILLTSFVMVAFFSCAEASLISTNKFRIRYMADQGNGSVKVLNKVLSKPEKFFSAILVAENTFIIFALSVGTVMSISLQGGSDSAILIATAIMTVVIVPSGEITPKALTANFADRWSLVIAMPIVLIMLLETSMIYLFTVLPRIIKKTICGHEHSFAPSITEG